MRTIENSAAYLAPHLSPGSTLLDVGCGPGTLTADLAVAVDPGHVVAIDQEPAVLREAAGVAAERGIDTIEFRAGDVYDIDADDGTFDVVHAHQVLQHLSDPVRALREMARVTRPGGIVAARDADYSAMTWYPADERLDLWLDVYRAVARANRAEPDAGRRLLAWASEAGFHRVTASASTWCFADSETRGWWSELWADRMTDSSVASQALDEGIATRADLDAIASGFRAWADDANGWFTVLHGEILAHV